MEAKTDLKSRLPSRHVTEGPARALRMAAGEMAAGEQVLDLIKSNQRACVNVARKSPENAAAVVPASGGSTNAALHLHATAHECGITFDLFDVAEVFKRTPFIADLKPGGQYVAKDLFEAGSIPHLMKTLLDNGFLHGECLTVTGCSMAENLHRVEWNPDQDVRQANGPLAVTGGVVGLRGNLAPDGAIVKAAGVEGLEFTGPARCFDSEEACFEDIIAIDAEQGTLRVQLSGAELENRRAAQQPREPAFGSGYLCKYAGQVGPARHGAVTHAGGSAEKKCHADI
jgi:dihydroxyacid dehydratase/phosphogluconate dehydratase